MPERRTHFLINKPLQLRFMIFITTLLFAVTGVTLFSLYYGVWSGVLDAFTNEKIQSDLITASRLTQYEAARTPRGEITDPLSYFQQAEKMSARQREIFREILQDTNRKLMLPLGLLLLLVAWGSIYLSHKTAGPLYRFQTSLQEIRNKNFRFRIYLRKQDEAQSLGQEFNVTLETLDTLFASIKKIIAENNTDAKALSARLKDELSEVKTSADA